MRYFLVFFALCLTSLTDYTLKAAAVAPEEIEEESARLTLYQLLSPVQTGTQAEPRGRKKGKGKRKREVKFKQQADETLRMQKLLKAPATVWRAFAWELQQVTVLARTPNIEDLGLIGVRDKVKFLNQASNDTVDLLLPHVTAGYTVLINALDNEFVIKNMQLKSCEKAYKENSAHFSAKDSYDYAMAYLRLADSIPTAAVNIRDTLALFGEQRSSSKKVHAVLCLLEEKGIQEEFPPNFFDPYRQLYFRKSAEFFYRARYLAAKEFEEGGSDTLQQVSFRDDMRLKHASLLALLEEVHGLVQEDDAGWGRRFILSLLLQKAIHHYYALPDFTETVVVQRKASGKKRRGKRRGRKKTTATQVAREIEISPEAKQARILEIEQYLAAHADSLSRQERDVEAEYRRRSAFLIRTLMYKKEMENSGVTLLGNKALIRDPKGMMNKIDELERVLEGVGDLEAPVLGYNSLKSYYTGLVSKLSDRLHMPEFASFSDEIKFKYYEKFWQLQEEGFFNASSETQGENNYIAALILDQARGVAPDRETERALLERVASLLHQPSEEDPNLFEYYKELCKGVGALSKLSGAGRKKMAAQSPDERALVRTLIHLQFLEVVGDYDQVDFIINGLAFSGSSKKKGKNKRKLTREEVVARINQEREMREAERAAEEELRHLMEEQKELHQRVALTEETGSYSYDLHLEDGERQAQASYRREIKEQAELVAAREARKATGKNKESPAAALPEEVEQVAGESIQYQIPEAVYEDLRAHRTTFEALFTRFDADGGRAFNDDVSVRRDDFLSLIIALGGSYERSQGKGSHEFVRFVLHDKIVDMEALPEDLAADLERSIARAGSHGTMTLSLPKITRGHNRRFLLPEQVRNARLVLAAAGLTPDLVFGDDSECLQTTTSQDSGVGSSLG